MIALLEGLKIVSKTQPSAEVSATDGRVFCGEVALMVSKDCQLMDALGWVQVDGLWVLEVATRPK